MFQVSKYFLIFILYSFVGYVSEIICSSIWQKKLVNRGFLCGPYCPIYGVGGLFILFTLKRFEDDPIMVFLLGMLITSALEYFTSFVLEKIFHNKWWDYSDRIGHLNGRICLQNSLLFGFGALLVIYFGQPNVEKLLALISVKTTIILAIILFIIFVIDFIYSFIIAYNLRNRIIICEELKAEKLAKLPGMLEKIMKERVAKFKAYPKRLLEAFPDVMKSNAKEFAVMKKIREKSLNNNKKKQKNRKK